MVSIVMVMAIVIISVMVLALVVVTVGWYWYNAHSDGDHVDGRDAGNVDRYNYGETDGCKNDVGRGHDAGGNGVFVTVILLVINDDCVNGDADGWGRDHVDGCRDDGDLDPDGGWNGDDGAWCWIWW